MGDELLYLDLPSDMPVADARRRVSVQPCKLCAKLHDQGDIPKYLPAGLTQYVLNNFSKQSPPYHVTQDDVGCCSGGVGCQSVQQTCTGATSEILSILKPP